MNMITEQSLDIGIKTAGADDTRRSFQFGRLTIVDHPVTTADGLRAAWTERTFGVIQHDVDDIVTVTDDAIIAAMRSLAEELEFVVEPSGAILDTDRLPWMI